MISLFFNPCGEKNSVTFLNLLKLSVQVRVSKSENTKKGKLYCEKNHLKYDGRK